MATTQPKPMPSGSHDSPSRLTAVGDGCVGGQQVAAGVEPIVVASALVNGLREATGLDHGLSRTAVTSLLLSLADMVHLHDRLDPIIHALAQDVAPAGLLESSEDAARLTEVLQDMSARKDDFQQRSWHLHDDRAPIERSLGKLLTIIEGAEPALSVRVLMQSDAKYVHSLVLFYQMETKADLKRSLLRAFTAMFEIGGSTLTTALLSSVLPTVLAGDIRNSTDEHLSLDAAVLLTQLLAAAHGELPRTHFEVLNKNFVEFLLDGIEGDDEQLSDIFMFLLLAFNWHVIDGDMVTDVLLQRAALTNLTEKVLIIFNRDDDLVNIGETGHSVSLGSATMKFLIELFGREDTANLFYTNDTNVLIDILVRWIHDLPPGDKKRLSALSLMRLVVCNADYASGEHKKSELLAVLRHIDSTCAPGSADRRLADELRVALGGSSN